MASKDYTVGGDKHLPYTPGGGGVIVSYTHDFLKNPHSSTDVLGVIKVPAGCRVLYVAQDVKRPEGATLTFNVGDGVTAAGYLSAANGNAAADTITCSGLALTEGTPNTITGYSNGKFYPTADTIDVVLGNNAANALITWSAFIIPMRVDLGSPTT